MKPFIFCIALWVIGEVSSSGVTIGLTPYSQPVQTQYQAQDAWGQYVYGYATGTSAKSESKSANGITQGGYSYIDPNGILQSVQYISDPINGFRVAATNLPVDVPEVALAKLQHLAQYHSTKLEHELAAQRDSIAIPSSPIVVNPVHDLPEVVRARAEHLAVVEATKARDLQAAQEALISPLPAELVNSVVPITTQHVVATPVNTYSYIPAIVTSSQYQTQDALGQYSYGYVSPLSSKSETKTADGVTRGGYSYLDANGIVQTVNYISDDVNGFRVAATNLPRDVPAAKIVTAPVAVVNTNVVPSQARAAQVLSNVPLGFYRSEIIY